MNSKRTATMNARLKAPEQTKTRTAQDPRWRAVVARDRGSDGKFVYGVGTTGIYCRPSCPSRRAKPENVDFFPTVEVAEKAGFRPCMRCKPNEASLEQQ